MGRNKKIIKDDDGVVYLPEENNNGKIITVDGKEYKISLHYNTQNNKRYNWIRLRLIHEKKEETELDIKLNALKLTETMINTVSKRIYKLKDNIKAMNQMLSIMERNKEEYEHIKTNQLLSVKSCIMQDLEDAPNTREVDSINFVQEQNLSIIEECGDEDKLLNYELNRLNSD